MNSFKVPFTRINFSLFHHAAMNIWGEDAILGTVWTFHLFPAKHFWKWGNKCRIGVAHYVHDIGFGPIFRLTKIISKENKLGDS